MTFEMWLTNHDQRIQKDLNISAKLLIAYINESDSRPIVDVVLWKMGAIYEIAEYNYEETMEYLNSHIEMYRRDYCKQEKNSSRIKGSVVSQLVNRPFGMV